MSKTREQQIEEAAERKADSCYHAQGDIHQVMPWSDVKESFIAGVNWADQNPKPDADVERLISAIKGELTIWDSATTNLQHIAKSDTALINIYRLIKDFELKRFEGGGK